MVQTFKIIRKTTRRVFNTKAKGKAAKLTKPVKKAVEQMINKTRETKYVSEVATGVDGPVNIYGDVWPQGVGGPPNGNPQLWTLIPSLSEGTTDFERIGTRVQPTRHLVDLDIKFNHSTGYNSEPINSMAWDLTCHVWYGYARRYKNNDDVNANKVIIVENMLEDGQTGLPYRWQGGENDQMLAINNDYVVLKHKKFRMYKPQGQANAAIGTANIGTPQVIGKRMRLTLKPPKALVYNEGTDFPENYCPFVIIGYQHNDASQAANTYVSGTFGTPLNSPALEAVVRSHLYFKDA